MAILVREKQLQQLQLMVGSVDNPVTSRPPTLLVWGHTQSGKGQVVEKAVDESGANRRACVSTREILCGLRPFLQTILEQLFPDTGNGDGFQNMGTVAVENTNGFIVQIMKRSTEADQMIIVLEDAERFIELHSDLLYALMNCQELTGRNVCVILSSALPISCFAFVNYLKKMPTLHFPLFNKEELFKILSQDIPVGIAHVPKTYEFIVSTILDINYTRCRNLKELRGMIHLLVNKKVMPEGLSKTSQLTLWNHMKTLSRDSKTGVTDQPETGDDCISLMPRDCKYMLIAAYLASINPVSSDRKFFIQRSMRKRKAGGMSADSGEPKSKYGNLIAHSRLLAIFSILVEAKDFPADVSTKSSITTLCNSKFIRKVDDNLEDCKYRCNVSLDFVTKLSNSIGFELKPYILHLR